MVDFLIALISDANTICCTVFGIVMMVLIIWQTKRCKKMFSTIEYCYSLMEDLSHNDPKATIYGEEMMHDWESIRVYDDDRKHMRALKSFIVKYETMAALKPEDLIMHLLEIKKLQDQT